MNSLPLQNKYVIYSILEKIKFKDIPTLLLDISYFDLRYPVTVKTVTLQLYDYDIRLNLYRYLTKTSRQRKQFLKKFLNYIDAVDLPGSAFSLDRYSMLCFADYLIDFDYDKEYSCLRLKFQEVARPFDL